MRRSARRTVAKSEPPTTINTPTPSMLVPTISMIRRKDSMAALIAGNRADFQCCSKQSVENNAFRLAFIARERRRRSRDVQYG